MDLVIDANIMFAALIKKSITSELIFRNDLHLYAPEYILTEFEKYREVIKKKTERADEEFDELMELLERKIRLIPLEEIKPFVKRAEQFSPDKKDVPYLALALRMNIAIWSNDKPLKEKQNLVKIYSTKEIVEM